MAKRDFTKVRKGPRQQAEHFAEKPPKWQSDAPAKAASPGRSLTKAEIAKIAAERGFPMKNSRRCPHGEPLSQCADCVREHNEATR